VAEGKRIYEMSANAKAQTADESVGCEEFLDMLSKWLSSEDGQRLKRPMSAKEIIATDPTGSLAKAIGELVAKASADPDSDLAGYLRRRGFMPPRIHAIDWRMKGDGLAETQEIIEFLGR
jgi:hypothetical protein